MKKYVVVEDLQGGEFGMGRKYTVEEWIEQAIDWHDADEYFEDKEAEERFRKRLLGDIKEYGEQSVIDYIANHWQIDIQPVETVIAEIKDKVSKNNIQTLKDLERECERYDLEVYEDILSPMEWNSCDKCGALGCSDGDFLWVEGFEWDEHDEVEVLVARTIESAWDLGEYWSALCWDCVAEIKQKAKEQLKSRA